MTRGLARSLAIWFVVIPFVHGAVPWMLSLLTPRLGWNNHAPGAWNWPGLAIIIAAAALLIYSLWWRRRSTAAPPAPRANGNANLMRDGPYGMSRNPVYLAYLSLWLGWSIFFGSIAVCLGLLVLCGIAGKIIVPAEERNLAAAFGDNYTEYKAQVPRWLGKRSP